MPNPTIPVARIMKWVCFCLAVLAGLSAGSHWLEGTERLSSEKSHAVAAAGDFILGLALASRLALSILFVLAAIFFQHEQTREERQEKKPSKIRPGPVDEDGEEEEPRPRKKPTGKPTKKADYEVVDSDE